MGQGATSQRVRTSYNLQTFPIKQSPQIQHQSFLKLRRTPFSNSVRVIDNPPLFLQNINTTLTKLISERMGRNKLFTQEDIEKLIQTCLYGLAHLQSNGDTYRDLNIDNIYYDTEQGVFKLLPSQLIYETSYSLVIKGKKFRYLSPEMIIALRMQEEQLQDEILNRSNVFVLGMILLEVCTLKPSSECYDDDNFDIFDKVIQQRLDLIKQLYPVKLFELLSTMLEYDYTIRMSVRDLSFIFNDEIVTQRNKQQELKTLRKSAIENRQDKMTINKSVKPKFVPSPIPYSQNQPMQIITNRTVINHPLQLSDNRSSKTLSHSPILTPSFSQNPSLKSEQFNYYPHESSKYVHPHSYHQSQIKKPLGVMNSSYQNKSKPIAKDINFPTNYKQKNKSPRRQTLGGSKYPSIIYQTDFSTKQNKDDSSDLSLQRIKEEIQRSRKRIQEFNRMSPMELIQEE